MTRDFGRIQEYLVSLSTWRTTTLLTLFQVFRQGNQGRSKEIRSPKLDLFDRSPPNWHCLWKDVVTTTLGWQSTYGFDPPQGWKDGGKMSRTIEGSDVTLLAVGIPKGDKDRQSGEARVNPSIAQAELEKMIADAMATNPAYSCLIRSNAPVTRNQSVPLFLECRFTSNERSNSRVLDAELSYWFWEPGLSYHLRTFENMDFRRFNLMFITQFSSAIYRYHMDYGHTMNNCKKLNDEIERLIRAGHLKEFAYKDRDIKKKKDDKRKLNLEEESWKSSKEKKEIGQEDISEGAHAFPSRIETAMGVSGLLQPHPAYKGPHLRLAPSFTSTPTQEEAEADNDQDPQDLEYVAQIKRVLELLRKNRDMFFNEVKLTIMIEDPRDVERRCMLGIDDEDAPTRDDLADALVEATKKKQPGKSLYAKVTDTGVDPQEAAKRLNIDWDSAAEIGEAETVDDVEVPSAVVNPYSGYKLIITLQLQGYGALYLVTAFPALTEMHCGMVSRQSRL
ncbi:hypothetical protin [Striga asiatica]|uniref:Hypothetical protin n=1 Tax=Striga asiatica TaxID=4170 RepID=A0A5A7QLJ9_STRAF|nr:hypothetical protin [Striga asiatica]